MGTGLFGRVEQELEAREKTPGLTMADILTFPTPMRKMANWLVREREVCLAEAVAFMEGDEVGARAVLAEMVDMGYVLELDIRGEVRYRVRLARRRRREVPLDIWQALGDKVTG